AHPQQPAANPGVQWLAGLPPCCTIEQQHWMKRGPMDFKFWNMRRPICPPLSDMRIQVSRRGRATFRFFAPEIDLTGTGSPELKLGAIVGDRCSIGNLSLTSLQRKKNGQLVYP